MSLQELLILISMWCQGTEAKAMCQTRMIACMKSEWNKPHLEPVFAECWSKVMR